MKFHCPYQGIAGVRGVRLQISDLDPPSVALHTMSVPWSTPNAPDGLQKTEWIDDRVTPTNVWVYAYDGGLGLQYMGVQRTTGQSISSALYGCTGTRSSPCVRGWLGNLGALGTSALPDGDTLLQTYAQDIVGHSGYGPSWHERIDRTDPTLVLTGDLFDHRSDGQLGANPAITVHAMDGSSVPGAPQGSGVQRVLLRTSVRNSNPPVWTTVQDYTSASKCDNCDRGLNWTIPASALVGPHTVRVDVWDYLGHTTWQAFDVNYYPTSEQYGGPDDHSINNPTEVASVLQVIEVASVEGGDALWLGVSPTDRRYIASIELSRDPQQICREAFYDDLSGYQIYCKHDELLYEDDSPTTIANTAENPYNQLNPAEKSFCVAHLASCRRFSRDAARASYYAEGLFVGVLLQSDDTMANAFRHSYWTALMTNSEGGNSLQGFEYAKAHENGQYDGLGVRGRQSRMDMISNEVGYWWSHLDGTNDTQACYDLFNRVISGTYIGPTVDPWAEYERLGFDEDFGVWDPITELVWRKPKTRTSTQYPVSVTVEPFAEGSTFCGSLWR